MLNFMRNNTGPLSHRVLLGSPGTPKSYTVKDQLDQTGVAWIHYYCDLRFCYGNNKSCWQSGKIASPTLIVNDPFRYTSKSPCSIE